MQQIVHKGPIDSVPVEFFPLPNKVSTPVNIEILQEFLIDHPDRVFVEFILKGFKEDFRIGYSKPHIDPGRKNLKSACCLRRESGRLS